MDSKEMNTTKEKSRRFHHRRQRAGAGSAAAVREESLIYTRKYSIRISSQAESKATTALWDIVFSILPIIPA